MISEKIGRERIYEAILGNYQMNYLTEIYMYRNLYRYCINNVFVLCLDLLKLMREESKK